ncbi:DUF4169 family protein [Paracoccus caeni]|uniref:DUF4169 family protein n=1 Tax=Paracoccus caeni TaxID=657651 RepID=A0A934SKU8_9RHOB|nr:DUF4169 family protein [Paracoccus caeni]MBK4216949.1 DUF4169 family protein [Paracoccus caeni]
MNKIVNLKQVRKQRDRAERRAAGDANAAKFGEAKSERNARKAEAERATRQHEGHRQQDHD